MKLLFLGTGAATACPLPFCRCASCREARRLGGKSLRMRSSLLVDGRLLIDLGPDTLCATARFGADITQVRYLLQTHAHSDHFDAGHLITRIAEYAAEDVPPLALLASAQTIERMSDALGREEEGATLLDAQWLARLNMTLHPAEPGRAARLDSYQIWPIPCPHDEAGGSMVYIISDGRASLLYATDTAAITPAMLDAMRITGLRLDAAVLDHTYGPGIAGGGHMNADQVAEACRMLRAADLLSPGALLLATHISHEGNPPHEALEALADGYSIACDGMEITI